LSPADHASIAHITQTEEDPNRRIAKRGRVMTRVYGYDVEDGQWDLDIVDAAAHEQTWADMGRLMNQGVYPAAFAAITCPVLMLHGEADPHPGRLTREDLRPHIPHLEYREFLKCGHLPWLERQARDDFFDCINAWIAAQLRGVIR
jgi:pimeloyl-ACP methyl ester carboxylesterase